MDCAKTGKLILRLRKEKGMTQQELADQLGICAKTVSKWECGLGCPDLSLWTTLSRALGADMEKLLAGELRPNPPDAGKILGVRFYVCPRCGNILTSTGEAEISCCGMKLSALAPQGAEPPHDARVEISDGEYFITLDHEMRKDHYIAFMACVLDDRVHFTRLYPEQNAQARMPIMYPRGWLYLYCTQHGLTRQRLP